MKLLFMLLLVSCSTTTKYIQCPNSYWYNTKDRMCHYSIPPSDDIHSYNPSGVIAQAVHVYEPGIEREIPIIKPKAKPPISRKIASKPPICHSERISQDFNATVATCRRLLKKGDLND